MGNTLGSGISKDDDDADDADADAADLDADEVNGLLDLDDVDSETDLLDFGDRRFRRREENNTVSLILPVYL